MNIRPLHDRIVVKRIEEDAQMVGGLYIPDSAKEKPQQGEVVAAGNGKKGFTGNGGAFVPSVIERLPEDRWAHTEDPIDFAGLAGKTVAVFGLGGSGLRGWASSTRTGPFRDVRITAAAPSLICDELPAVTLPLAWNAGRSVPSVASEVSGRGQPEHGLPEELGSRGQPLGISMHDLAIVVNPADRSKCHGHEQHDPHELA